MDSPGSMLTVREVSELLKLPVRRVWSASRNGQLPAVRVGRSIRFPRADILELANGASSRAVQRYFDKRFFVPGGTVGPDLKERLTVMKFMGAGSNPRTLCEHLAAAIAALDVSPSFWPSCRPEVLVCSDCHAAAWRGQREHVCAVCGERFQHGDLLAFSLAGHSVDLEGTLIALPPIVVIYARCPSCRCIVDRDDVHERTNIPAR